MTMLVTTMVGDDDGDDDDGLRDPVYVRFQHVRARRVTTGGCDAGDGAAIWASEREDSMAGDLGWTMMR